MLGMSVKQKCFKLINKEKRQLQPSHVTEMEMGVNSSTALRKITTYPSHNTVGLTDLPVSGKNKCVPSQKNIGAQCNTY